MSDLLDLPHHPACDLFPSMTDDDLKELAADITAKGLNRPVTLYDDPSLGRVLLDGKNRLAACKTVGVRPRTTFYKGTDPIGFSVSENLRHRHLTAGQKAAVATDIEPLYAAEAAKRKAHGETAPGRSKEAQEETLGADRPEAKGTKKRAPRAREKAATATGTSGRSVARFKRLNRDAPDLAEKVRNGKLALDRAERILRDREAETERIRQAQEQAATAPVVLRVDLRHGDFREVLTDLENIDAVITDPPYSQEFLPLLADLAAWTDKVLAPDGVLAVLIGQTHLPEVYRLLNGHRTYRWTACYLTEGPGYVSHARKVQSNWKPLIVYGGTKRFADVIRSKGSDSDAKNNHVWGQDYGAFHTIVERLTEPGQTVADPFMGSGTTLLAAHALGRHAVGCDTDEKSVTTAKGRLL